jgi:acetolactate synthase-1/2/3 large subunit
MPIKRKVTDLKDEDILKAVDMIKASKKPFLYVGGGVILSDASNELREFANLVDAPVCDSLMGKGAFSGHDSKYTGMIGMHGTKTSNFGVSECDLLIAIGARFSDRVTGNAKKFARHAKILHIDVDPAEINKNIHSDASIIGDAKEVLTRLNKELTQQNHKEWLNHISEYASKYPLRFNKDTLNGPNIMEHIDEITKGEAIIATDVGQHQMWAAQHYKFTNPRTLLTSGGLGTMGYGLGAAIGAKVGRRDKVVINIAGDGCFRMNMNELATATRYNIPVIEIIFNNQVLGMVRQWQDLFYGKRYSATVLDDQVDFVKVSEGLGAHAVRVTTIEEFDNALKESLSLNIPCVIECMIGKDDKVFPMVSPGAAISDAFDREDLNKREKQA